ncbi:right-handed parallel beta-helix repeat-containing protein [Nocardioides sp. KIGAM211]|uniref:Right-handed parallel beta-helix repeat-containing protein n=1 Tax=Nocardioides luti TaxID=2761101 RepID=A0A7X0RID5_9ACTN|nr:right-handed parallel beta-helix repeat-containing protein [Nocardioides luti]MBB6628899.1 right-handed parallel beta-helix repeat-containing protein [Nocardioides luti]
MTAPDPTPDEDVSATARERGDTIPRWLRNVIRLVAVLALVGATAGLALARNDGLPDLSAPPPRKAPTAGEEARRVEPEVRLLAAEDARLRAVSLGEARQVGWVDGTLVLGARRAPYTLATLVTAGAVTRSGSTYLLTRPVVVRRDARLVLDAPGATLRMASAPRAFTSIVSWGGSITLAGTEKQHLRVVGWDARVTGPDKVTDDGRAYVRVKDGTLDVAWTDLSYLGFWSGRTGGLALTGSSETSATGTLDHVSVAFSHIGLYLSGARQVDVRHADIRHTDRHGIEASNRSERVHLRQVEIRDAGEDGVSSSNGSARLRLDDVEVSGSGGYGLEVDGSPLADGMNSAGYGTENYAGLRVAHSDFRANALGGIAVRSMDAVSVTDRTTVESDRTALDVHGGSRGLVVSDSRLLSTGGSGLVVRAGVRDASVSRSRILGDTVAVEVTGSSVDLSQNDIGVGTGHGVDVRGASATATISGNTISGRGAGAVHGADGAQLSQASPNVTDDWTYRPSLLMWAEKHSAAMPLLLVLVLPVLGTAFVVRRRRQQRELRRLFEAALVSQGRSSIAAYDPQSGRRTLDLPAARAAAEHRGAAARGPLVGTSAAAIITDGAPPRASATTGTGLASLEGRRFASAREFAVAAVLDAGFPASQVAQVLHLPTSRVRAWVAEGGTGQPVVPTTAPVDLPGDAPAEAPADTPADTPNGASGEPRTDDEDGPRDAEPADEATDDTTSDAPAETTSPAH